jgi:tetratricopeptide (TPR) repeat protein
MRNIKLSAVLALTLLSFSGCALTEKRKIAPPLSPPAEGQSKPSYSQQSPVPKKAPQPRYLDLSDQDDGSSVTEDLEVNLPGMAYVNDRIFEYGRKLGKWKDLDAQSVTVDLAEEDAEQMVRCFRRLQNVLNGYSELRSKMLQAQKITTAVQISSDEIQELQRKDIAFLENVCGRLLEDSEDQSLGWGQREESADLGQLETLIDRYSSNGEFEEVIQVWQKVPEFQIPRIQLRTKIMFGNALMYLHQEEKAAQIYRQVVDQMSVSEEQATDLVSLRKVLADLYTASGNYKAAELQYKKISEDYLNLGRLEEWSKLQLSILDRSMEDSPELSEYSSLLRNFLGFIPEQDGYNVVWQAEKYLSNYPYSPVSSNADVIKDEATKIADRWFNAFMEEVDSLGAESKFLEALELLETLPTDIISAEKQLNVKAKNQELLLTEAVEKETEKMAKMQELQHQWNNGMVLAKDGSYDEAIVVFTNLLDTEYSIKAENKIEEVALEAAKTDRKKAAKLFIRFTKTTDVESQKALLIESRKLLKDILVKYPEVEIAPKVLGNIGRVEQEMNILDPGLIQLADLEAAAAQQGMEDDAFDLIPTEVPLNQPPISESLLETDMN